jgi:outer membrane protein OmpA-like peptidoglycan-associated protein
MIAIGRRGAVVPATVAACAMLCACATGTVILLPSPDGHPTAVTVRQGEREVVLAQPYAAATPSLAGPFAYKASPREVEARFGAAVAAQPRPPATFTLNFELGTDALSDASKRLLDQVFAEIAKRPVPDVLVIGHTDTMGNDAFNDALGQQRADAVRDILVRLGVPPADIRAVSRGKRELAVPTGDNVDEPRNRRVVIEVR